jgi:GrpB-like predicted nucleotidyltransferase (UPF0157 family)
MADASGITDRSVLVPYDPAWPRRAAALLTELRRSLGPLAVGIEHIGSTAVPGMAAKDVLDLQVSVADLDVATAAFDAPLRRQGFRRLSYERDHVPAGYDDDPARWAKRFWSRREHVDGDVNLHLRMAGSPNERLALLFRDWLRAHPAAAAAYAAFKATLANAVADLATYADVKDPVVDLVIAAAEPWAATTGWTPRQRARPASRSSSPR